MAVSCGTPRSPDRGAWGNTLPTASCLPRAQESPLGPWEDCSRRRTCLCMSPPDRRLSCWFHRHPRSYACPPTVVDILRKHDSKFKIWLIGLEVPVEHRASTSTIDGCELNWLQVFLNRCHVLRGGSDRALVGLVTTKTKNQIASEPHSVKHEIRKADHGSIDVVEEGTSSTQVSCYTKPLSTFKKVDGNTLV